MTDSDRVSTAGLRKALSTAISVVAYLVAGAFVVSFCGDLAGVDGLSSGALVAGVLCYVLFLLVMLAGHEYAHAVTARLFGQPVLSIDIGSGYKVLRWTSRGTVTTLRILPSGGLTRLGPATTGARTLRQYRWIYAAGPMGNAVLAAAAIVLALYLRGLPAVFATMFALVQAGGLLGSLWPRKPSDRNPRGSDGWHLWQYRPWGWTARLHELNVRSEAGDAAPAYRAMARRRAPRGREIEWYWRLATHAYRSGLFEECARAQGRVTEQGTFEAEVRALVQAVAADCRLSAALRDGRQLDEEELGRCSVALFHPDLALTDGEVAASVQHSRALLLLARGDAAAAFEAGKLVLAEHAEAMKPADAALVVAMTAIAATRAGSADASAWAERVPAWCPLQPAVQRESSALVLDPLS